MNTDRMPPHSLESERGVISSILSGGQRRPNETTEAMLEAQGKIGQIGKEFFFVPAHRTIWDVLVSMFDQAKPLNFIALTQELGDRKLLDSVGGPAYVTNLGTFVPTASNIRYYLDVVQDKYMLRQIIAAGTEAVRQAYEEQDEPRALLEEYQAKAIEIGRLAQDDATAGTLAKFVDPALKDLRATFHARGKCTGISTGFVDLDRCMNGFEAPLTYYFAARPAMGKSSIMLAFAEHIAIKAVEQRRRIKIFSLEMTGKMLAKRLICSRANIELKAMRHGFMDQEAIDEHAGRRKNFIPRADQAAEALTTDYVHIDEKGDLNILEFRARARQAVMKDKCEIIMVDYLQRMKGASKRAQAHRELEINEIAQGISTTAKELGVPIVVLAQLNRKPEDRWDGRPELGDVRESGSIEQEARFVGLLWRPWYYAPQEGKRKDRMLKELKREFKTFDEKHNLEDPDTYREFAVCFVAKQNEGPVGPIVLRFQDRFARFEAEDPDRPLFSNKPKERQEKPYDKEPAPAPEETNGEPNEDELNKILALAKEGGFTDAEVIEDE